MQLSLQTMNRMWLSSPMVLKVGIASTSDAVFSKYGIVTLAELTDFMAQISEETGGGVAVEEDLDYTAQRLCQVWPARFPTQATAEPYAHNPEALANYVYGGRYGNRFGTDDGYNFRGRGLIQLTFRANYEKATRETGLDLVNRPELVSDPLHILECAAAYWKLSGANTFADRGDFTGETRLVNGGLTNLSSRESWRKRWQAEFAANPPSAGASLPGGAAGGKPNPPGSTKGTSMTSTSMTNTSTSVPTVSSSVTADWGSVAAQIIANEQTIIVAAANAGVNLALAQMPFGSLVETFIGPTVIDQYISQALVGLETFLKTQSITVSPQNAVESYVMSMITSAEPWLISFLGPQVETMVSAAVAKIVALLPPVPAATPTSAPTKSPTVGR